MRERFWCCAGWLAAVLLMAGCRSDPSLDDPLACHGGAYRLDDGTFVFVTPVDSTTLRYRFIDGRSGRLYPGEDGAFVSGTGWSVREPVVVRVRFGDCDDRRIEFNSSGAASIAGARVELEARPLDFTRDGVSFAGRLLLPEHEPDALVVLVHGSEKTPAIGRYVLQYLLPTQGIAVFVFDKRGTGGSGGEYTQDFDVLASDVVAAVGAVRSTPALAGIPVGLLGGSQGGWVAPLAATRTDVDFVIATYGMAEGPLAEDREEVQSELRALGYDEDVLDRAREVTDATGRLIATDFQEGSAALAAVKARYGDEPWFAQIHGEYTGDLIRYPLWLVRLIAPFYDQGTTWDYAPRPVLERIDVPMLWVLGGRDTEAPSATTVAILTELQRLPGRLDIAVFPNAEHGIIEVQDGPDGRRELGHSPGYFPLLIDWIAGRRVRQEYGDAVLYLDPIASRSELPDEADGRYGRQ